MQEHINMSGGCGAVTRGAVPCESTSPGQMDVARGAVPCGQGMQDVRLPSQQGSPCTDKHSMSLESQCTMKAALSIWCGVALWCGAWSAIG